MTFSMNGYEEWKEKNRNEKAEISKMDLIEACGRVANIAAEPKNKAVGILEASIEAVKIIDEFFPEKKEEEPDAEKPAEKTELSALEKLLFEQTYLAVERYKTESSGLHPTAGSSEAEVYGRFKALYGLVIDAGAKEKYKLWKAVNGYK